MENKSFIYRKYRVRYSKKGFLYESKFYPYALLQHSGVEVYFDTKEEAKEYIDKILSKQD